MVLYFRTLLPSDVENDRRPRSRAHIQMRLRFDASHSCGSKVNRHIGSFGNAGRGIDLSEMLEGASISPRRHTQTLQGSAAPTCAVTASLPPLPPHVLHLLTYVPKRPKASGSLRALGISWASHSVPLVPLVPSLPDATPCLQLRLRSTAILVSCSFIVFVFVIFSEVSEVVMGCRG